MPLFGGRSFKTSFNQGRPPTRTVGESAAKRAEAADKALGKKRKKEVIDVDPKNVKVKKSKLKPKTNLVPAKSPKLEMAEQKAIKIANSLFGEAAPTIIAMIESDNKDGATLLIYKRLLMTLVSKIPLAEKMLEDTHARRGIYQFNALVSQCRELMADIQAVQDRGAVGRNLVDRNVRPAFLDIATQIVQTNHRTKLAIKAAISDVAVARELVSQITDDERQLAVFIQERFKAVSDDIIKGLT